MNKRYETSFKHKVCQEYQNGGVTKVELQDKYGIRSKAAVVNWLRDLGYIADNRIKPHSAITLSANEKSDSAQLKALKKELEDAQLKLEAYQRMIAIAEKKFKIEIEKKSDSK